MSVLDIPVEFGAYGCGKTVARLGVKISRTVCNIDVADEAFCGHRLTGKVVRGGADEMPNQTRMLDTDTEVSGTFDVKSVHLTPEHVSISLSFSKKEVKGLDLEDFVGCAGRLVVNNVAAIPDDADDDEEDEDKDQVHLKFDGDDPRDCKLEHLFSGKVLEGLLEGKLDTVGMLADYTSANKDLTDLPNIGPGKAEKIRETMIAFWKVNNAKA
jgi:hypothetical protein